MLNKQYIINGDGKSLILETKEMPKPKANEVLIKHEAIGINYFDINQKKNIIPVKSFPYVLGCEAVGTIIECGSGNFKVGDRIAYALTLGGAYSHYRVINEKLISEVPADITSEQVAAFLYKGMSAHYLLRRTFYIRDRHTILVHGAASGLGHLIVRLAKRYGAKVIGTVSSQEKLEFLKNHNCDHIINHSNFHEEVMRITDKKGVNAVFDIYGNSTINDSVKSLDYFGLLVILDQLSGEIKDFNINLLKSKSLFCTYPKLIDYKLEKIERSLSYFEVYELIRNKTFPGKAEKTFTFEEIPQIHAMMENRKSVGSNVVLL